MAQLNDLIVTGNSRFLNEINGKINWSNINSKPTIPTVNNATLTIQKNGTNVQTFTANQATNATANITVPTKVSELTNDSGYTTNTGTVTQVKVGSTSYNPSSGVVSLPAYPTDTNTHRPIQVNGTQILGNNTTALNLKAGNNISITNSSGTVTIAATGGDTSNCMKKGVDYVTAGQLAGSTLGIKATAEGENTVASGNGAHAEGGYSTSADKGTFATGENSHAEGYQTTASGEYSHAEGDHTVASGGSSHAEGLYTTASDYASHAEGIYTTASGYSSHAEGEETTASGEYSHAEGNRTTASGESSHAEGYQTSASRINSHAEGKGTAASGNNSHAEGFNTSALGVASHTEGGSTYARGDNSHTEGYCTTAYKESSHAEGLYTSASGNASHAEGTSTVTSGDSSHAEGYETTASNYASHAGGHYNAPMTPGGSYNNTTGTAFVIGNGTSATSLKNAFSVQYNGVVKAASTITASTTADYAEFFEWSDENPNNEDRVGYFVTVDENEPTKIRIANSNDDYILGIVSGDPFVLGNGDCDVWNGMVMRDEFGRIIYEPAQKYEINPETGEEEPVYDEDGNPVYEGTKPVYNPEYDPTIPYISRFDRPEWSPVGMLGVLHVKDDGSCTINGYCTVGENGIATKTDSFTQTSYKVIARINNNIIKVIFR